MIQSEETQLFMEKLFRLNKLVRHQVSDVTMCPQSEFKMLGVIQAELEKQNRSGIDLPGVPISRLSKLLLHSKPATSRILRTLEEKCCIMRIPSNEDRRTVYVTLTETGEKVNQEIAQNINMCMNQILYGLGPEDTAELLRLMDRLYEVVTNLPKKKGTEEGTNAKKLD